MGEDKEFQRTIDSLQAAHFHACEQRKQTIAQMLLHAMEIEVAQVDVEKRTVAAADQLAAARTLHEATFDLGVNED